ncbi:hypothetical protein D3C81_2314030 [compost metagenome]
MIDLPLNQQGIEIETTGQILDLDAYLRIFNGKSAGRFGHRLAVFLLSLEQHQAPGFPGYTELPQVHLL